MEEKNEIIVERQKKNEVDVKEKYFPCCICWATIRYLSDIVPVFGHTAISDPNGWIYDFEKSYQIGKLNHSTFFGEVKKYVKLDLKVTEEEYVKAIQNANDKFSKLEHDGINTNCHAHVSEVLNQIEYMGRKDWNTKSLVWLLMTQSHYVDSKAILLTYLPCILLLLSLVFVFILLKSLF